MRQFYDASLAVDGAAARHTITELDWLDELIEKIWLVESSGRLNPTDGDNGEAIGPLQIHKGAVDDVNKFCGGNYSYEDRFDLAKSKEVARLYITYWLDRYKEEIAARIFNGGPRGWEKESTKKYWEKISATDFTDFTDYAEHIELIKSFSSPSSESRLMSGFKNKPSRCFLVKTRSGADSINEKFQLARPGGTGSYSKPSGQD